MSEEISITALPTPFRRVRSLAVLPEYAIQLRGLFEVLTPAPDDAVIVGCSFDANRMCWLLMIESESFEPILAGEVIPPYGEFLYRTINPKNITERRDS